MSPEDAQSLEDALIQVVDTIGNPEQCGISDRQMRQVLWDTYFDVPAAVDHLLREKEREEVHARKQAGESEEQAVGGGNGEKGQADDSSAAPSKPSAAARPSTEPEASAQHAPAGPAKPLSKLQQKVLENKAKKAAGAKAPVPAPAAAASAPGAPEPKKAPQAPQAPQPDTSTRLFPTRDEQVPLRSAPTAFTSMVSGAPKSRAVSLDDWRFAGPAASDAAPAVPDTAMEQLRHAFSALSPDDRVLDARKGTSLAR